MYTYHSKAGICLIVIILMLASMAFGVYISWDRIQPPVTDGGSAEQSENAISGNANVTLQYLDANGEIKSFDKDTVIFSPDTVWKADSVEVVYATVNVRTIA